MGPRHKRAPVKIQKLSVMLPIYLQDSGCFVKMDRIDWSLLEVYKDKESGDMIGKKIPFKVEFV